MILTIHQPEHIPWLGFFHKIEQADSVIFLDDVQFSKNYFQNRNKVRTANGWNWVTVPVHSSLDTLIKDVPIVNDSRWKKKWWRTIYYAYQKTQYADQYLDRIQDEIMKDWYFLSDFNISMITMLSSILGINKKWIRASEIGINSKGSSHILDLCQYCGADTYLSGISGRDYLQMDEFEKTGIRVFFQEFHHPIYTQIEEPFIPCMSVIDLLCNHGPNSLAIIKGINVPVIEELFL